MILWYFNHKAGGAYRPDCFTVRNTNFNYKIGPSIQKLEYRWDNQNPKLIVTDPNGYSAYVSLTKYQG